MDKGSDDDECADNVMNLMTTTRFIFNYVIRIIMVLVVVTM